MTAIMAQLIMVSQRLGHASPMVMLTVYAHVTPGNQREAAAARPAPGS
jgi:integrase